MNILADENCGWTLISALISAGHDVTSVVRTSPGIDDEAVFALALKEGRVLMTHDLGFGRMAERAKERSLAIVLMRLGDLSAATRAQIVARAISELGETLIGHFVVIEPVGVRSRRYKD